jgi:hypothetical protein
MWLESLKLLNFQIFCLNFKNSKLFEIDAQFENLAQIFENLKKIKIVAKIFDIYIFLNTFVKF